MTAYYQDDQKVSALLAAAADALDALEVKHQMALDRDCHSCAHQPPSKPLSPQSGTDTRSTTQSPQMVGKITDLGWFGEVLDASRERLDRANEGSKSSWYKEHSAESKRDSERHALTGEGGTDV